MEAVTTVPPKHKVPVQVVPAAPLVSPSDPCNMKLSADGSGAVTVYISPETLRRYKLRAQNVPLDKYLFDNVLRAALESHVY